jgi:hypothetical protein
MTHYLLRIAHGRSLASLRYCGTFRRSIGVFLSRALLFGLG